MNLDFLVFPAPQSSYTSSSSSHGGRIMWIPRYASRMNGISTSSSNNGRTNGGDQAEVGDMLLASQNKDFNNRTSHKTTRPRADPRHSERASAVSQASLVSSISNGRLSSSSNHISNGRNTCVVNLPVKGSSDEDEESNKGCHYFNEDMESIQAPTRAGKLTVDESDVEESDIDETVSQKHVKSAVSLNQALCANPSSIVNYSFSRPGLADTSSVRSYSYKDDKRKAAIDPSEAPLSHIPCLYLANNSEIFILYFHGNGEDVNLSYDLISHLQRYLHVNVIAMEYPGYGIYEKPQQLQDVASWILNDAEYLYKYLTEVHGIKEKNIILFGRSIGSGTAAHLAARNKPGALVLMSAFRSLQKVASDLVGKFLASMLRDRFNNEENIKKVTSPTFILHGQKDTFISYSHSIALFENCSGVCEIVLPKLMSHVDVDFFTDLSQRLIDFLTVHKFNMFQTVSQHKFPASLFREPAKKPNKN